ncbi:MAG: winged helix-turn-helix domain-containing protein [Pseudomonadota bacterium]
MDPVETPHVFEVGPFELDGSTLRYQQGVVRIPKTELAALRCLVQAEGMVTRSVLKGCIWGDKEVADSRLARCIYALRRRLAAAGAADSVETVPGCGFRLGLPVRRRTSLRGPMTAGGTAPRREARKHYFRAYEFLARRSRANLDRALAAARRAAELDDSWSDAWGLVASVHVSMVLRGCGTEPAAHASLAEEAAAAALRSEPSNVAAVSALAWVRGTVKGETGALALFDVAPRDAADLYQLLIKKAWTLFAHGRIDDGLAEFEAAARADPLCQGTIFPYGYALFCAGRVPEARRYLERALVEVPTSDAGHHALALVGAWQGEHELALRAAERAVALSEDLPVMRSGLAYALAMAGYVDRARDIVAQLDTERPAAHVPPSLLAPVYEALGERGEALACLRRAARQTCCYRGFARIDPRLRGVPWP